jgi:hypothetical protein
MKVKLKAVLCKATNMTEFVRAKAESEASAPVAA